ncbi:MAG: extracellular solute-binding protein, partial [Cytophagaceae bacterium]|nr:extracellular solute-binding protein [Gemmatimonadaceae bacterium]
FARSAWATDDGKVTYCVPMASVLHGFIYNKDYFGKNGLKEPATYEEFLALLDAIKKEGSVAPWSIGTKEGWTTTSMGFDNIGPNFWGGDSGRKGTSGGPFVLGAATRILAGVIEHVAQALEHLTA